MLIIQWLKRLPASDGIVICRQTATNCDTTDEVDAKAQTLWANAATLGSLRPDGFQVVDQDGRSICVARYAPDGGSAALELSGSERARP